jgi:hypothetical protein
MSTAVPSGPKYIDWRTLYRAAILESNRSIVPQRVSEAEEAVIARGREIFYADGTREEKDALEDALYALRAFRTAWKRTEAA